ncbi:MAG: hypothetical protein LBK67_03390 [Coriobacteriales bacterium]|jgi:hypothetical protein|nr:hypothetical protein [Coriobacteriales bacterium]
MPRRFIRIFLVLLLLAGWLFLLSRCIHFGNSGPYTAIDSYDEVKRELADLPGVIFPDISAYDEDAFHFWVSHPPPNGEPKTGYSLQAEADGATRLKKKDTKSTLSYFSLLCDNEELSYQWTDSSPAITANMVHRGTPIEAHVYDDTEWHEQELAAHDGSYLYPEGTQVFRFSYEFSFEGYQYAVTTTLTIPPERIGAVDIEEEKAAANAEAWELIDNILDQGGAPQ